MAWSRGHGRSSQLMTCRMREGRLTRASGTRHMALVVGCQEPRISRLVEPAAGPSMSTFLPPRLVGVKPGEAGRGRGCPSRRAGPAGPRRARGPGSSARPRTTTRLPRTSITRTRWPASIGSPSLTASSVTPSTAMIPLGSIWLLARPTRPTRLVQRPARAVLGQHVVAGGDLAGASACPARSTASTSARGPRRAPCRRRPRPRRPRRRPTPGENPIQIAADDRARRPEKAKIPPEGRKMSITTRPTPTNSNRTAQTHGSHHGSTLSSLLCPNHDRDFRGPRPRPRSRRRRGTNSPSVITSSSWSPKRALPPGSSGVVVRPTAPTRFSKWVSDFAVADRRGLLFRGRLEHHLAEASAHGGASG